MPDFARDDENARESSSNYLRLRWPFSPENALSTESSDLAHILR
jgi:hypothetical protein